MHPVVHYTWKEKWPNMLLNISLWAVTNGLARWSENWKEHENWWQRNLGKRYVYRLLWVGKKMFRCGSSMWVLTKGWPQQGRILVINSVEWSALWIPVSFPSHSCYHSVGSWKNGQDGREGGYVWAQQHELPLTKYNLAPEMIPFPGVIKQLPGNKLIILE